MRLKNLMMEFWVILKKATTNCSLFLEGHLASVVKFILLFSFSQSGIAEQLGTYYFNL